MREALTAEQHLAECELVREMLGKSGRAALEGVLAALERALEGGSDERPSETQWNGQTNAMKRLRSCES
jgi:hypothetical protein